MTAVEEMLEDGSSTVDESGGAVTVGIVFIVGSQYVCTQECLGYE